MVRQHMPSLLFRPTVFKWHVFCFSLWRLSHNLSFILPSVRGVIVVCRSASEVWLRFSFPGGRFLFYSVPDLLLGRELGEASAQMFAPYLPRNSCSRSSRTVKPH